jgi:hypothetical protein
MRIAGEVTSVDVVVTPLGEAGGFGVDLVHVHPLVSTGENSTPRMPSTSISCFTASAT